MIFKQKQCLNSDYVNQHKSIDSNKTIKHSQRQNGEKTDKRRHISEWFSDQIDQNIRTQCALSWKIVVSEWLSVIAVSLNVGGGIRFIKPTNLYEHAKTLQIQQGRAHGAGCARPT